MKYDQAFTQLTKGGVLPGGRNYGPQTARGLLHAAAVRGSYTDELPRPRSAGDGPWTGIKIATLNDAGTEFSIRTVTISRP